jgi:hypothetical protein
MKNLKQFAIFSALVLVVAIAAHASFASARENILGESKPNVLASPGHVIAFVVAAAVLLIIGGCLYCNGPPTGGGGTNAGSLNCMEACVENGGDDFDCLDQCGP